ncbi:MAG: ABC transporter substrate-binding protein, partial [Anaerolineales bacterium]
DYISAPYLSVYCLVFNTARAPFDDPRIRRAFMMAADKQAGVAASSGGALIPAMGGLIPPGIPGHSPGIGLPYDPVGAQELMTQAGYPNGRGFPDVEVLIWPDAKVRMEGLWRSWREALGVDLTWNFVPFGKSAVGEPFHMWFIGWAASYPDPDDFLGVGFLKETTGWQVETFDELVTNAKRMLDQAERVKLYQEADRMLIEEAVVLPLTYSMTHLLVKPWIKRFPISPMQVWFLKDIVIEPH